MKQQLISWYCFEVIIFGDNLCSYKNNVYEYILKTFAKEVEKSRVKVERLNIQTDMSRPV